MNSRSNNETNRVKIQLQSFVRETSKKNVNDLPDVVLRFEVIQLIAFKLARLSLELHFNLIYKVEIECPWYER